MGKIKNLIAAVLLTATLTPMTAHAEGKPLKSTP